MFPRYSCIKVKSFTLSCFAAFIMLFGALAAEAAVPDYLPYPSADSTIINPYGAGDETGLLLNAMQPYYRAVSGRNFKVENVTGRGGATGWGELTSKPGDGYTLGVTNLQNMILRSMATRPVFQMEDFYQVCIMAEAPLVLWVPQNSPFKSLQELVRSAKAYPDQLIIAGTGSSTVSHLASLQFNFLSGTKTIYLPYLGTTMAMQAAHMGQAHAAWGYPLADYGKQMNMRPLAVAAQSRSDLMGEVPTFDELNIGLIESCHFGLALPASASANIRQEVTAVFQKVIDNPEFHASLLDVGFSPKPLTLQSLNQLVRDERARFGRLLNDYRME